MSPYVKHLIEVIIAIFNKVLRFIFKVSDNSNLVLSVTVVLCDVMCDVIVW